jgi:hypothetical protein
MTFVQRSLGAVLFTLFAIVVAFAPAAADIVSVHAGPSGLFLDPLIPFERGVLNVSAPDGASFRQEFSAGAKISFSPFGRDRYHAPDGTYLWEVILALPSAVDPRLQAAAKASRESGDPEAEVRHRVAMSKATQVQSGAFTIQGGTIVPSNLVEPGRKAGGPRSSGANPFKQAEWLHDNPDVQPVDQVIPDDLIVTGSLCVGFDCVNNENFGFDTIRLKENNLRIKFEDTSVSPFPTNDWQLTANDSASGGSSKFSIEDITGARVPFTVTAGAATNSIFVDSTGRVGFRTSTPVLDLHVATSNTPALRLEQNNSGGFAAQTWDVGANEANFFVRDATNGSTLPLRIRPGAPSSSLDIASTGNVGVGLASAAERLQVRSSDAAVRPLSVQHSDATRYAQIVYKGLAAGLVPSREWATGVGNASEVLFGVPNKWFVFDGGAAGLTGMRMVIDTSGRVGIGTSNPANPLQMASGAFVSAAGVWTDASSRALKQDIRDLTLQEARGALDQLAPVRYTSKIDPTEQHVGFIAEDVPDLVATKDRKALSPMDIVAVLTRVVQEQQKSLEALAAELAALKAAAPAR